ncbi:hypothetical protein [Halobacterium sp. KA-6]|uniref:hypothetical protein n=1 Tax=Halobacterium sp. KA-6 TaxID=2896368 RepID=UPI001E31E819|nr:hypothetical protein [Halobacterium sp. KA-6]MCD2204397.1 hypothetical protein [Halobacterium sp. KA-6]
MTGRNPQAVTLTADDLNDLDEAVLDLLHEGRVTPTLAQKLLVDRGEKDSVSRQYVNQRLKRLEEHEHIENLLDTGVYELDSDPREQASTP